jgi:hypothetical protein
MEGWIMACKNCKTEHLVIVDAKCSDLCNVDYKGQSKQGYVPDDMGIGGGNYIKFSYCPNCGMMNGDFPINVNLKDEEYIDEDDLLEDWDRIRAVSFTDRELNQKKGIY